MKCSSCGARLDRDQNFCRVCGATVDPAISVRGTRPSSVPSGVMIGFAVLMVGTFVGVIGRMLLENQMVAAIGVLIALAGIFFTVMGSFRFGGVRRRNEDLLSSEAQPKAAEFATSKLPELHPAPFPASVTENTTDLLPVERDKERR